ncbi:glycosyltransferase family 39 protein [Ferriphaselus sp. R-1]|uniref:ArnT family glycosyltransferase n=1 Tax=Ferriphaselus sp. R-1 TaxID=1485544 RepID=UPI00068C2084|nr:glycosyltransferase family 39 protein [Ferriphaselus sp. R-1]
MNIAHARWLILLTLLVNAAAMLSPVINSGDSITYAALAQHIALSGDWSNLVLDGQDWLDKPHLPFWITALSFKLLGSSAFSYILPGFLFHLLGGYFTYRIARLFYGRDTAWLSVLVFVSAYHLMDSSIEVKAETYLTGTIMGACYYWLRYDAQARLKYLLLGALFSAMAVMTKGVFTLITISSGLVAMWLYQGQWRKLWGGKWLLALVLTLLFTAPEVVALYLQFDAHPEKVMFGQTHVSGIKFFLWDSQFGRFFNTGPIKNTQGHPFYFVLVFLWAFLPWVAVFVAAMSAGMRRLWLRSGGNDAGFVFLCGAFFVTFGLFSATSFQLDHYTVILFPFAAILCGKFLADWLVEAAAARTLRYVQWLIAGVLVGLVVGLSLYTGNVPLTAVVCTLTLALLGYVYATRRQLRLGAVTYPLLAINLLFVFLSMLAALTLGRYDVAHNVAQVLADRPPLPVYVQAQQMTLQARELGLYLQQPCIAVDDFASLPSQGGFRVVMQEKNVAEFTRHHPRYTRVAALQATIQKTGTFPKMLKMAQGSWPLDEIAVLQVP